jgi:uncharacterized protein (DUF2267 family)
MFVKKIVAVMKGNNTGEKQHQIEKAVNFHLDNLHLSSTKIEQVNNSLPTTALVF